MYVFIIIYKRKREKEDIVCVEWSGGKYNCNLKHM